MIAGEAHVNDGIATMRRLFGLSYLLADKAGGWTPDDVAAAQTELS
jgi:hypothetical protein